MASKLSMEERERLTGKPKEWLEGWDAYMEGKELTECPYPHVRNYRKDGRWRRGYQAAKDNSERSK